MDSYECELLKEVPLRSMVISILKRISSCQSPCILWARRPKISVETPKVRQANGIPRTSRCGNVAVFLPPFFLDQG
jgi:hypothetical protein